MGQSEMKQHWNQLDSLQSRCLNHLLLKTISDDLSGRRIHTQFSTHTQTGRIFTVKPNLQTTPKQLTIRGVDFDPRNAFVAAEGCVLICADFKQIELRVLTHLSQDKELKTAIESEDDVFKSIASQWHRRPLAEITEDTRTQTKSIVYAIIYGMGPRTLAAKLDLSLEEAADLYVSFKRKYADIETFCNRVVAECRQNGYVRTLCGRRRYIEDINASDNKAKGKFTTTHISIFLQGALP
ncbi:DNA polymerase nu-like [Diaphorina citri]|uniref:DNA polymerase nu-like n=1 Tax=Diaphorina citri TaxID=121845 RepID=A0A3Q0J021_DIACI|nr:DNA polymerase nu-like [Diaphorina citri]